MLGYIDAKTSYKKLCELRHHIFPLNYIYNDDCLKFKFVNVLVMKRDKF